MNLNNTHLISLIYDKVEKHLENEFKIGLEVNKINNANDKRVMKSMLQQKAVNLSYIFNSLLIKEWVSIRFKDEIELHNKNVSVRRKDIKDNDVQIDYHNMSLMEELLFRLSEKDKPAKILPFFDRQDPYYYRNKPSDKKFTNSDEQARYYNRNQTSNDKNEFVKHFANSENRHYDRNETSHDKNFTNSNGQVPYYNRSDSSHYKKVLVKNFANSYKLMAFYQNRINVIQNHADFAQFEQDYNDFVHNMLLNNEEYQFFYDENNVKTNVKTNVETDIDKNIDKNPIYQLLNKKHGFSLTKRWLNEFNDDEFKFYRDENYKRHQMYFNEFDSMINNNSNSCFKRILTNQIGLKQFDKEQKALKMIFDNQELGNMNFINFQMFSSYFKEKYHDNVILDLKDYRESITLDNDGVIHNENQEKENIKKEMKNVAQNMKVIYLSKLKTYDDYVDFYQKNQTFMEAEGIHLLKDVEFNDLFSESRFQNAFSLFEKGYHFLKEDYKKFDKSVYSVILKDEEMFLFEKVKKQLLQEIPELSISLFNLKDNITEQEVGIIFSNELPFNMQETKENCYAVKRIEVIDNQVSENGVNRKVDKKDFDKMKDYHAKCDFYFPYLKQDENLTLEELKLASMAYNNDLFEYSSAGLLSHGNSAVEFYVKNNGMKEYQLTAHIKPYDSSHIFVKTSCSSHDSLGLSQLAYNAMVDFAEQNNMIVCRDITKMTKMGKERLINKLDKAAKHNPDALLIDYVTENHHDFYFELCKDDIEYEVEDAQFIDEDNAVHNMNKALIEGFQNLFEVNENKKYLEMNLNQFFVQQVVFKLNEIFDLQNHRHKTMTKEQYDTIKQLHKECHQIYIENHAKFALDLLTSLNELNENMVYDKKNDKYVVNDKCKAIVDKYACHKMMSSDDCQFKIESMNTLYLNQVIKPVESLISSYIDEMVKEMLDLKQENKLNNELKERKLKNQF